MKIFLFKGGEYEYPADDSLDIEGLFSSRDEVQDYIIKDSSSWGDFHCIESEKYYKISIQTEHRKVKYHTEIEDIDGKIHKIARSKERLYKTGISFKEVRFE